MPGPRFEIPRQDTIITEADIVSLSDLKPGQLVTVRASCIDAAAKRFSSSAVYEADHQGRVVPSGHPSVAGSYLGLDPFGPWWSMRASPDGAFRSGLEPVVTAVEAVVDGVVVAKESFRRLLIGPGVSVTPVEEESFVGQLFEPEETSGKGVVILGGSGGGFTWAGECAALLASQGFVTLAVAYFGLPGLPTSLCEIAIESLQGASAWLLSRPSVSAARVGVVGSSRGGEVALLLASLGEDVGCVVAYVASGVAWGGFTAPGVRPGSAWSLEGEAVPYLVPSLDAMKRSASGGIVLLDAFVEAMRDGPRLAEAAISVEKINGPILLVSAGDDLVWPSGSMSDSVMSRRAHGPFRHLDRHLHYCDAGHGVSWPPGLPALPLSSCHPINGRVYESGGSRRANAEAAADAWPKVLAFLEDSLSRSPVLA